MNHPLPYDGGYEVSTDPARLDFKFISASLHATHWAASRRDEDMVASFRNALAFGLYAAPSGEQVGFARVITDQVVTSFLTDVFIAVPHRRRGLGGLLMRHILEHPHVRRTKCRLGTRDAHAFFAQFGFERQEVMRRKPAHDGRWNPD